ncbi:MAG: azurin [Flavobacteriaceae bacterium]|nr:azurin [Flavobacteriaceae bacterium]|tara:strand:+ start:2289 stop:2696 length:408 start_codon:yes stop_codon:yes gene_type:complete
MKSSTNDQTIVEREIEIVLNSDDLMRFDKNMLLVQSGQKITLTLNHTGKMDKSIMGHNFVLLKKDVDVTSFAEKAVLAKNNEYIPEGDEVIVYTKLLGGGESDTITFDAPEKGYYTFLCTFPGHWGLMKGKLVVK